MWNPVSVGIRASGNEYECYQGKQELLFVGMVKWQRRLLGSFVMSVIICLSSFVCHWHWADHMCVSGVGWRHLGAKHSGILLAEVTGLLGPTGIWQKRSLCIGLEKMNSSQLRLALVVEENHVQLCERGNQSKSLAFDFLIHRFWEISNHGRRWTLLLCAYLWLLKGWWTLSIQSWQMLMGCKLLYSFSWEMCSVKEKLFLTFQSNA